MLRLGTRGGRFARPLLLVALALAVGLSTGAGTLAPTAASAARPDPVAGSAAARPASWPSFIIGASYQGPATRAWRGDYWAWWANDLFDRQMVNDDFARAAAAGLNTLRLFVQLELLRDIRDDDNWSKLDTVLDLADQHGLRLILTLADYDERRLERLTRIDGAIAARYAGRKTILAYDLRNEPTFWMLQSADYPDDKKPPLFSRKLMDRYGEQAANHYVVAFRASDEGQRGPLAIPDRFSEEEAYVYHNNWILSYRLSQAATDWALQTGRSDLEYFGSPEGARWKPFLEALDATYSAWLDPRLKAIRKADPKATITIGHHDALMAALPANRKLDVMSLHRYVPPGLAGLADQQRQVQALRTLFPDKPVMMGEFGHRATEIGDEAAAVEESATWLHLLADGYAGGLKWMLNDTRDGTDTMGMYRMDATPRPVAYAASMIARLAQMPDSPGGTTLTLSADDAGGTCFRFTRGDVLALGGRCGVSNAPVEVLDDARQVFTTQAADGGLQVGVTAPTRLLFRGVPAPDVVGWTLTADGVVLATLQMSESGPVTLDLEAGRFYELIPRT